MSATRGQTRMITLSGVMAFGDAAYRVTVKVDMRTLARVAGQKAAWSKGGKVSAFDGAVVVTAKQANVARGRK